MSRQQAWIDIALALLLVGISTVMVRLMSKAITESRFSFLLVLQGIIILLGLRFLLVIRGQSWRHLGLGGFFLKDFGRILLILFSCIGVNIVLTTGVAAIDPQLLKQHLNQLQFIANQFSDEISFTGIAAMMFFVGVYEEIMARGFLLNRCQIALGSRWKSILLSSFLFGLGHLYQGWIGVVQTTLFGIVLALFTTYWGTLWPGIFAHALMNTLSLAILAYFTDG